MQPGSVGYREPETTNPEAGALEFSPADPARDLESRLLGFSAEAAGTEASAEPLVIDLAEALRIAQRSGREYLTREETYILSAISLLIEQHRWGPRLFNDTTLSVSGGGEDGSFESALSVINDLRVTKRLPFGGTVEAGWVARATRQLQDEVNGEYRQSSEIALDASIPLMRGSGQVARESLIQSQRNLVYAAREFEQFRRSFLVSIASDYFSLLEAQARISNQKRRLVGLEYQEQWARRRADAGLLARFNVDLTSNQVLSARAGLAASRDAYIAQMERFKVRLGIDVSEPLVVVPLVFDLAEPEVSLSEAVSRASQYRLDWQNEQDQLDDSLRQVAIARDGLRPDLNLTGSLGLPTDPDDTDASTGFSTGDLDYSAGLRLSLPLDREIERLQLRSSTIQYERARRSLEQFRDNLIIEVRSSVRAIDLARFQYELAARRVAITESRLREQRIRAESGEVTPQEQIDALNENLEALNARDAAQTDLRVAILNYLLQTGQMRVGRDGQLTPLPGMDVAEIRLFEEIDDFGDWYRNPVAPLTPPPGEGG